MSDKRQDGTSGSDPVEPPFTDWEVPEGRRRMPPDLQRIVGASSPVLRTGPNVHEKLATRDDGARWPYFERLDELLVDWRYIEPFDADASRWVIYGALDQRWVRVIVGRDSQGSFNLVSVFPLRDREMRSRLRVGLARREGT